jgi:hypothetical protein
MADNLSVAVTADTSELHAQLALAQADLRAFGAETRKLANDIHAGGVLRSQLEQVAGQFNAAKSEVTGLTGALRDHRAANDNAAIGIKGVNNALAGMLSHRALCAPAAARFAARYGVILSATSWAIMAARVRSPVFVENSIWRPSASLPRTSQKGSPLRVPGGTKNNLAPGGAAA